MNEEALRTYLNDHLAGAVFGADLTERCMHTNQDEELATFLPWLLEEIRQDQEVLRDLRARVGGAESSMKDAAAWIFDKLSRTKLTRFSKHEGLNRLEELEVLMLGVRGKLGLWETLAAVTGGDERFSDVNLERLKERAGQQYDALDHHRLRMAHRAFLEEEPQSKKESRDEAKTGGAS